MTSGFGQIISRRAGGWDAFGIFDEIAAEILKFVESDEGLKKFVADKSKHQAKQETAEIETAIVGK